jgi:AraC-like DNA-binding protein
MRTVLLERLRALLLEQTKGEGFLPSNLPNVIFLRMDRSLPRAPTVYEPCILIVAQGHKIGVHGGSRHVYDCEHCLVLTLPLPLESETVGSPEEPFLALAVRVTQQIVTELLVQMDSPPPSGDPGEGIRGVALETDALAAAVRLVESLREPERARLLGPNIVRELVYLLLRGAAGAALGGLAMDSDHQWRIGKIVQRMHRDFAERIDVSGLAREAGMSASTFHARFKTVTGVTPLAYQKLIRLHKAKELMVNSGATAQSAAVTVGYESVSQFSREFSRLFGDSPGAVASQLRAQLRHLPEPRLRMTLSFP